MTDKDFIEFEATNGRTYSLHVQQIRGFDGTSAETRIRATIGGDPITFRVAKPYKEIAHEWRAALTRQHEESA